MTAATHPGQKIRSTNERIDAESTLACLDAHAMSPDEVCVALKTTREGLSRAEAAARLARHGRNELPTTQPVSALRVFVRQFRSPLVYILVVAAMVSAAMRDWSDGAFIFAVLLVNATIGSIQEFRAERSAEALKALVVSKAFVARDGEDHEVESEQLVPGDLVILEAGSKAPADVRLFADGEIEADESLLTGESYAAAKSGSSIVPPNTAVADRTNMAFAGTLVTRGRAHGLVVATASSTQLGRIATSIAGARTARPPLLVRMDRFTKRIALVVAAAVTLMGVVSLARGANVGEVFMLAVALAVSAIPEGLPVALTVALSIGARRMGRRNVIARRLVAVEALGSCTFIASDKTGTLTMNELTVRAIALPLAERCDWTGEGIDLHSDALTSEAQSKLVRRLATAATLCNDGFFGQRDGEWVHHGDAVDVALLMMASRAGVHHASVEAAAPRLSAIAFAPELKFAATLHDYEGGRLAIVKGAEERLLPMCTKMASIAGDIAIDTAALESQAQGLATDGFRVLAIASGTNIADSTHFGAESLHNLVFLGFVGMLDPLRPEAKASVRACQAAGVEVAMVTGDHPVTALAIARELGFADRAEQVVTGRMLDRAFLDGPVAVDALTRRARVFARVEPSQKLEIVRSLIRLGHFVAVTGDGANDAPALRAAHIGVAMGKRGTDVARESADLVLADDNFASIVAGIEEGRIAYANVRKVIFLLISSGAAEIMLFVLTAAVAMPLPLHPAQLLWLNLVTNGIQDVALAFEPAEGGELARAPRPPREPIFNRVMVERTLVAAVLMALVAFFTYRWMLAHGWSLPAAQNGVLLLLVLFENIQAGNSRSETRSLFRLSPLRNRLLLVGTIVAQLVHILAMYTPGLRDVLHLEPVSWTQWLITLGLASSLFFASEIHKALIRWREARIGAPTAQEFDRAPDRATALPP